MRQEFLRNITDTIKFTYSRGDITEVSCPNKRVNNWNSRQVNVLSQVREGRIRCKLKGKGKVFIVDEGDAIFTPTGLVTRSEWHPTSDRMVFCWGHVMFTALVNLDIFQ